MVVRLGRGFTQITPSGNTIEAGAGCLDIHIAAIARDNGLSGLEFLSGIPGTIGGALAMNAGAYSSDISNILIEAEALDDNGMKRLIPAKEMGFSYRKSSVPESWIFTKAKLQGHFGDKEKILGKMQEIAEALKFNAPDGGKAILYP